MLAQRASKQDEVEGLLQPKLNLKVSQRQVLTPGLVQMVSVLALNKLELKEMINTEMVENPVLEEVEESAVTIEEMAGREAERERSAEEVATENERVEKKDPFDEVDFGSYFQDYLDPGFRTVSSFEEVERPSFENFLSQPSTLTDHLDWQLGSMSLTPEVRLAADLVVGNLNEDGYLTATDEELVDGFIQARGPARPEPIPFERGMKARPAWETRHAGTEAGLDLAAAGTSSDAGPADEHAAVLATVLEARKIINQLDPLGVGARDLRECLLIQISAQRREAELVLKRGLAKSARHFGEQADGFDDDASEEASHLHVQAAHLPAHETLNGASYRNGSAPENHAHEGSPRNGCDVFEIATHIVANHLALLQKKDMRELTRGCGRSAEEVQAAVDLIRTLDPRPGQRYNVSETRLIEPDVAFVKRDGEYVVLVNEEDMPTLRLSHAYRKMLRDKTAEKDVREYVKERYKSAIQLLRNIEQRKNTIVRTCEVIVRRQQEFLEQGEQGLKPMMIKEVAEEIGVHPSTVSRAVANKYVHTSQGVYELRFFFSEGVNGPEGGDLPLVLLKRKVKKLIEDEDSRKPLTDDQLAAELQRQGIRVTRRTVAKYREDMNIPSTHQRRVR
ncbi:MAG: RNA polymerase factor sigma-54 [Acidobacteriaceae bacterium]